MLESNTPLRYRFACAVVQVRSYAAEAGYGSACPPLLCLEGWPSSAGWALLDALVGDGAMFRYHGDFDWDGLRIASLLYEQISARPCRFSAADYLVGVSSHADRTRPLDGRVAAEGHQRELVAAMLDSGRELHEEPVLEDLLIDLACLRILAQGQSP